MARNSEKTFSTLPLLVCALFTSLASGALAEFDHAKFMHLLNAGESAQTSRLWTAAEQDYKLAVVESQNAGATPLQQLEGNCKLAVVLVTEDKRDDAEAVFVRIRPLINKLRARADRDARIFSWLDDLAAAYMLRSQLGSWELGYRHAVELWKESGQNPKRIGQVLSAIAKLQNQQKRYLDAIASCKEAMDVLEARTHNSGTTGYVWLQLAIADTGLRRYSEAEEAAAKSVEIVQESLNDNSMPTNVTIAQGNYLLGHARLQQKKFAKAQSACMESFKYYDKVNAAKEVAENCEDLCKIDLALGKCADAEKFGKRALDFRQQRFGGRVEDIDLMKALSSAMKKNRHFSDANKVDAQIKQILIKAKK